MTLEQRYRAGLNWYPRSWRRANEDVVVGTLLDVADAEGRDTPSRAELRDLRRAGLAARADAVLPGTLRDRVAAISLGAGTALALAAATGQAWGAWPVPIAAEPDYFYRNAPELVAPDHLVWQLLVQPAFWILAALASLVGWTAIARVLVAASIPVSLIGPSLTGVSFLLRPSTFTLVTMAVLALLTCIGRPPRRWQLSATAIMGVLIASWLAFLGPFARTYFPRGGLIDFVTSPWPLVALLVALIVFVVLRRRVAAAAVLVAAAPWLVLLVADGLWLSGVGGQVEYLVRPVLILAIVGWAPLAILLVARRYARPPWLSPSESSDSPTSASRPSSTR